MSRPRLPRDDPGHTGQPSQPGRLGLDPESEWAHYLSHHGFAWAFQPFHSVTQSGYAEVRRPIEDEHKKYVQDENTVRNCYTNVIIKYQTWNHGCLVFNEDEEVIRQLWHQISQRHDDLVIFETECVGSWEMLLQPLNMGNGLTLLIADGFTRTPYYLGQPPGTPMFSYREHPDLPRNDPRCFEYKGAVPRDPREEGARLLILTRRVLAQLAIVIAFDRGSPTSIAEKYRHVLQYLSGLDWEEQDAITAISDAWQEKFANGCPQFLMDILKRNTEVLEFAYLTFHDALRSPDGSTMLWPVCEMITDDRAENVHYMTGIFKLINDWFRHENQRARDIMFRDKNYANVLVYRERGVSAAQFYKEYEGIYLGGIPYYLPPWPKTNLSLAPIEITAEHLDLCRRIEAHRQPQLDQDILGNEPVFHDTEAGSPTSSTEPSPTPSQPSTQSSQTAPVFLKPSLPASFSRSPPVLPPQPAAPEASLSRAAEKLRTPPISSSSPLLQTRKRTAAEETLEAPNRPAPHNKRRRQ
ncbi:hypothetical protein Cob_v004853 [Colletotrichum orbiculare MAFF 240422]|uniref:Uncharacterized protein n=1 Tax=Colletotrichum orbiculare (strain 104-T / ATCC 96160 / CBS 514.97 / LARS 414 / MAFF 240422) TaxID=1213857 RepID=N4VAC3_COLOR|nr:hypothetical protein Cob_v004853 [Colletotrichum orbiculare MAFF 240422]